MNNKILSIQNISLETLGTLKELISFDGYQIYNIEREPIPNNAEEYAAIIILGGPMAVYDNVEYLKREQELIRHALKHEIPILGICLGSQLIAQSIGGKVYKGIKNEIGWYNIIIIPAGHKALFKGISTNRISFPGTGIHTIFHQTQLSWPIQDCTLKPSDMVAQLGSNSIWR